MNWDAFVSLATFAAVLVALWPIFSEANHRKALAINLRARLLTQFTLTIPIIKKRIPILPGLKPTTYPQLSEHEMEPLRTIEAMLTQAVVLRPKEHDLVVLAYANLSLWRHTEGIETTSAENVAQLVDSTINELQKGSWHRGGFPSLPWKKD